MELIQIKSQSPLVSLRAQFWFNSCRVRHFTDDTALNLAISSTTESDVIQTDLACLEQWEKMWDMQFNPPSNHKKPKPFNTKYILHNVEMESVSPAKYLGVTIADDLSSWTKHIDITTKRQTNCKLLASLTLSLPSTSKN